MKEPSSDQPRWKTIDFSKHNVDVAFSILSGTIYDIFMTNNVEFSVLRRSCIENTNTLFGACIPEQLVTEIKACDNLSKLFDVLAGSPYWSWINIRILTKMAGVSCIHDAMELVEKYKEAVFSRKLSLLLDQIPMLTIPADYYTKVQHKWNKSFEEVTIQDLVTQWTKIEELFDVKEPTLLLDKVVKGCVEIHWLIPTELVHHICCAAFNARHTNKSIVYLKVDDHVVLCNDEETEEYSGNNIFQCVNDLILG